jgi:hypothetical protein
MMEDHRTAVSSEPVRVSEDRPARPPTGRFRSPGKRTKRVLLLVAGVLAIALVAGMAWFEPYKLLTNTTVNEADPGTSAVLIAHGSFVSHEHETTGSVRLLRLPDGTQVLRLDRLKTSNGPVLKVLVSDAPVRTGKSGWHVFDDRKHIGLGKLKGNKGSQNYFIPRGLDLASYHSVTIWCDRFNVSFGAAALEATG